MKTQIYPLPEKASNLFGIIAIGLVIAGIIIYIKNKNDNEQKETNFEIV